MSQTPEMPQVTGKMFLFNRPELLNREQHGDLGIAKANRPFSFCAKVRAIPLTLGEVTLAMRYYPIVFTSKESPQPLAVVGVIDDVNLFVDDEGQWDENAYVPAYLRRYPFAVANETGSDRMAIVIDTACEGIVKGGELPLFANGEPTDTTEQAIEFCKQFEVERRETERLMMELAKYDLIQAQTGQYSTETGGLQKPFAQYFSIDEERVKTLPDAQFNELRKTGLLRFVYAQLISFIGWRDLMHRRARRFNLSEDSLLKPLNLN